jgi:hypothetical protein
MRKALAASAVSFALVAGQVNAGGMARPIKSDDIVQETTQGSRAGILGPILAPIPIAHTTSTYREEPT